MGVRCPRKGGTTYRGGLKRPPSAFPADTMVLGSGGGQALNPPCPMAGGSRCPASRGRELSIQRNGEIAKAPISEAAPGRGRDLGISPKRELATSAAPEMIGFAASSRRLLQVLHGSRGRWKPRGPAFPLLGGRTADAARCSKRLRAAAPFIVPQLRARADKGQPRPCGLFIVCTTTAAPR